MAIAPGRYSFIGGTVLGNAGQFVLVRSNMSSDFTNDEYKSCTEAVSEGKAVCVQWKSGSAGMQAQLASITNDGSLLFSFTTANLVMVIIVSGSEPHSVTAHSETLGDNSITPVYNAGTKIADIKLDGVSTELFIPSDGGDQFVLARADMTAGFTNEEYQACVDAVNAGRAVCVQYGSSQVQLAAVAGGALYFNGCSLAENFQYVVSPTGGNHTITRTSAPIGNGIEVFNVSYSTSINDYVYPSYAEVNAAVQANKVPVLLRYIHDSPVCQCFVFKSLSLGYINFQNDEMYVSISRSDTVEYGYIDDRNLAAAYDPSATYALGAYCMYQNVLYTCTSAISSGEPWTPSHWAGTSVSEQIGNVEALLAAL